MAAELRKKFSGKVKKKTNISDSPSKNKVSVLKETRSCLVALDDQQDKISTTIKRRSNF